MVYGLYERLLEEQVQAVPMPGHIGIILDGNRRHARASGMRNPEAIYRLGAAKLDDILAWSVGLRLLSRARTKLILVTSLQFLDLATRDAGDGQGPQLAFLRSLLASVRDMTGRAGPDRVPFAAVVRAADLGGSP